MPRRFIHICGESGVGKKTLVRELVRDAEPGLRERFGGAGGAVAASGAVPADYIRPMDLFDSAAEDHVIHNWQIATHDRIERSRRADPGVDQRIFVPWCPYDIHVGRINARQDLDKGFLTVERVELLWRDRMIPMFRGPEGLGFAVEVVDASASGYPALPEWPG